MVKKSKKCRQWLLIAACFILVLSNPIIYVFAEYSESCGDEVYWSLNDGVMFVSGSGQMYNYSSEFTAPWNDVRNEIREVIISDGVLSVGVYSFHDCNNLVSITLSDSVKEIGDYAFAGCENLRSITFGSKLEIIGDYSFKNDEALQNVIFPETLKSIGYEAFYRCKSLVDITVPTSVISLENCVFAYCTKLKRAIINAEIDHIPDWMFYGCTDLTIVSFSSPIYEVGNLSFYSCDSLNKVYIKSSDEVAEDLSNQIKTEASSKSEIIQSEYTPTDYENELIENSSKGDDVLFSQTTTDSNVTVDLEIVVKDSSYQMNVETSVTDSNQWETVVNKINGYKNLNDNLEEKSDKVYVYIEVDDDIKVEKEVFENLYGKPIELNIKSDGVERIVDCELLSENTSFTEMDLRYELKPIENRTSYIDKAIKGAQGYLLNFKGSCDYQLKVKVFMGLEYARNYASLFQKKGKEWNLIHSVQIDYEGYATFYLAGYDSFTDYLIGINVEGVNITNAYIPSELSNDYANLIDENGNMYEVTGIKSKWGISLKQFTFILVGIMGGIILIVGGIMYVIFKMKQNKERIRLEIMRGKQRGK